MLDELSRRAEQAATSVSRRHFLGRFSRTAMVAAGLVAGVLALPRKAQASKTCRVHTDCPWGQVCDETGHCRKPR
jgi:hypothetical protein